MEYKCPADSKHEGVCAKKQPESSPHYGALLCAECNAHIKWLSSSESWRLYDTGEMPAIESPESKTLSCPISREPCMEESCAWWWKVGDMGDCLVMRIGKLMSMPLVTVETKDD